MKRLLFYFVGFYFIWLIKEFYFGWQSDHIAAELVVKLSVWMFPVYLYTKYIDRIHNPFVYLKLTENVAAGISWGIGIGAILVVAETVLIHLLGGHFNFDLGIQWVSTFVFAFAEEVVFRGFILQKLSSVYKFTKANIYTSMLFVSIHFPIWFSHGTTLPKFVSGVVMVFLIGVGLGYLFKRTNSLWSTTILHSVYNLLIYVRSI